MLTLDEAPWVEYLEIDEETGKRRLQENTPPDIREKYETYCLKLDNTGDEIQPK